VAAEPHLEIARNNNSPGAIFKSIRRTTRDTAYKNIFYKTEKCQYQVVYEEEKA
jgi:hypothetical protein